MFAEKMSRYRTLIDEFTRQTTPTNRELHELLGMARESLKEIERLEAAAASAWADGDLMAWRDYMGKAMQSLVVMTGARVDKDGLVPNVDGMEADVAVKCIAMLAETYADAALDRDRLKRRGTGK
jgi:hypothetical protein